VEICLLIEAETSVLQTYHNSRSRRQEWNDVRKIQDIVCQLQPDDFVSTSLGEDMSVKLYNAKKNISGCFWKKIKDWQKELCTQYLPKLPKALANIPNGHQLMDVYKKFVLDCYKQEHISYISNFVFNFNSGLILLLW
jgi:hypothetical protein